MSPRPLIIVGTRFTEEKGRIVVVGADYPDAIADAGGVPLLSASIPSRWYVRRLFEDASGLLLTGSRDIEPSAYGETKRHRSVRLMHPRRQEADFLLCKTALRKGVPILGVCGGAQVLNVVLGGSLIQHIPERFGHRGTLKKPKSHTIQVKRGSLLHRILKNERLVVNSYHHQAVRETGKGLVVSAFAEGGIVEGIEHTDKPLLGVQWHPEREEEDVTKGRLFRWLVTEAEKHLKEK